MSETFFISDTHFGHNAIRTFTNFDGEQLRPEFSSVEEMDVEMIRRWNSVVSPNDTVWHLGDVGMRNSHLRGVSRFWRTCLFSSGGLICAI